MSLPGLARAGGRVALVIATVGAFACGTSDVEDIDTTTTAEAGECSLLGAGSPWWNRSFEAQSGRFHAVFSVTPADANIDAVIGLSNGPASRWTHLAAIVRFNPWGTLDVRAGSEYRADTTFSYWPGNTYQIRFDVDLAARTYSVHVKSAGHHRYQTLATDYPFRAEQAAISRLDNVASFLEPSRPGSIELCGFRAVLDDTTGNSCLTSTAGQGFANARVVRTEGALIASFNATPSAANMDGVVGVGDGWLAAYNDYAASIRFFTNGLIEARDGDSYRADIVAPYEPGVDYQFLIVADVPGKTYSVFYSHPREAGMLLLATGYRFRPQQLAADGLDHVATIVASSFGTVEACDIANAAVPQLALARIGQHAVAAASGGEAVISNGTTTVRLDAAGRQLAAASAGGQLAVDAATGDIYVASAVTGRITLGAYASNLARRWQHTTELDTSASVGSVGVFADGRIAVTLVSGADAGGRPIDLLVFDSSGVLVEHIDLTSRTTLAVALRPTGYTLVRRADEQLAVTAYDAQGAPLWERRWSHWFDTRHATHTPDGSLVFAGEFSGTVDFGDGPHEPFYNPDGGFNVAVVALRPDGQLAFTQRLYTSYVYGLAADGARIALSSVYWTQFPYMKLHVLDAGGQPVVEWNDVGFGEHGYMGTVALVGDRLFANLRPRFSPSANAEHWPLLVALEL